MSSLFAFKSLSSASHDKTLLDWQGTLLMLRARFGSLLNGAPSPRSVYRKCPLGVKFIKHDKAVYPKSGSAWSSYANARPHPISGTAYAVVIGARCSAHSSVSMFQVPQANRRSALISNGPQCGPKAAYCCRWSLVSLLLLKRRAVGLETSACAFRQSERVLSEARKPE